jgi:hypothetical protein
MAFADEFDAAKPAGPAAAPDNGSFSSQFDAAHASIGGQTPAAPAAPRGGGLGLTTGLGEGALHIASGGALALAAGAKGWWNMANGMSPEDNQADQESILAHTYQPTTTIGKAIAGATDVVGQAIDTAGGWVAAKTGDILGSKGLGVVDDNSNTMAAIKTAVHATTMAAAPKIVGEIPGVVAGATKAAGGVLGDTLIRRGGSPTAPLNEVPGAAPGIGPAPGAPAAPGAAGAQFAAGGSDAAGVMSRVSSATPEMQASIQAQIADAQAKFGDAWSDHIDFDALGRQVEADSLMIPGRLSAPQAAQNVARMSDDFNSKSKNPQAAAFFDWQNKNQAANLSAIRDSVGPDVNTINPAEHGETLIKAYQDLDAPVKADIDAKYKALRDANGGQFPVDAAQLYQNIQESLGHELLTDDAPAGQMNALKSFAENGNMTFENYLALRRNLGNVARGATDGNTRFAASTMIQELENLPLQDGAAALRPMADAARSAAKARFDALDNDPAYKAAVNGSVEPDDFVNKFIVRGKKNNVAQMGQNLASNDVARQTMGVAVMDHLRDAARLNSNYEGNFAADSFNRQVNRFAPSMDTIFRNGEGAHLRALGNYARNSTYQPRGSSFNNSASAITLMGEAARQAGSLAGGAFESVGNGIVPGMGSVIKNVLGTRAANKAAAAQAAEQAASFQRNTMAGAGVFKE